MTAAMEMISIDDPVVSANWLHSNLGNSHVKVLDGSWYMPHEKRNPFQEYQVAHVPGALFFDLDGVVDVNSDLPHMLPSEEAFSASVSALGISNEDTVVVYDGKGFFSAPRIWWMFRVFGHDKVWVLDGGFPRWRALGCDIQSTPSEEALARAGAAIEATKNVYLGKPVSLANFQAKLRPSMVWNLEQVQQNIDDKKFQHVDARSKGRFYGVDSEPRKGIKSGHIPGSKCIPFPEMFDQNKMLLPASELANKFQEAGISLDEPVIVSCGSGVTACVVVLVRYSLPSLVLVVQSMTCNNKIIALQGLYSLGKRDVPLYDASWTEWALKFGLTDEEN